MITLATVQAEAVRDTAANLDKVIRFSEEAAAAKAAAVCFPEAFLTGYFPEDAVSTAISADHTLLDEVKYTAKRLNIDILVGFFERFGDELFITHGVFRPDGKSFLYRKTHLGEKESRIFSAGRSLDLFELSCGIKIGFQLCVETHFPRITETLSLKGAQVIFAPHAVPAAAGSRKTVWGKYIPARSYDNRVYFACCNHSGEYFGGGCMITAPNGDIIASDFDSSEALVTFDADIGLLSKYRIGGSHRFRYYPRLLKGDICL